MGVRPEDAAVLADDRATGDYFEAAVAAGGLAAQTIANWITGELFRLLRDNDVEIDATRVSAENLAALLALLDKGAINATVAKEVLSDMFATGDSAQQIVDRKGLTQISDQDALVAVVRQVLDGNPGPVQQYLDGKDTVMAFLIGQVMRATRGQANAQVTRSLLQQELEARR
jgi:aspartyl-tRNA(Asn)/glutamyl-tRNA(Gln) amidotransferase subunit B